MRQPGGDQTPLQRKFAHRRFDDDPVREAAENRLGLSRQTSRVSYMPPDDTSPTPDRRNIPDYKGKGKTLQSAAQRRIKHSVGGGRNDSYNTKVGVAEPLFQLWKEAVAPNDSGADYDLRGAMMGGATRDVASGHWPDTYKKPNHPTFSDQSQYSQAPNPIARALAGHWNDDQYQETPLHKLIKMLGAYR